MSCIKVKQEAYQKDSKSFSIALSKAKLKGIKCIKEVEESKEVWYWRIDLDTVNMDAIRAISFNNKIANQNEESFVRNKENFLRMLEEHFPISFDEFIAKMSSGLSLKDTRFYVQGDIVNQSYHSDSSKRSEYCMYDFLDNHETSRAKRLFIDNKTNIINMPCRLHDYKDRRIKALVEARIDTKRAGISLKALKIEDLGDCSRISEYKATYEKYKDYIDAAKEEFALSSPYPRIVLICGKNHGMKDFISANRYKNLSENLSWKEANMNDIAEISADIEEVNQNASADIICIVRGGGNAEDMCKYNSAQLVKAIIDSEIPVVTGLGHVADTVLAQQVADYAASTPTAAMEFLNKKCSEWWSKRFKEKDSRRKADLKAKYDELFDDCKKLQEKNKKLLAEKKELQAEIDRLKNRGILARIRNN